LVNEITAPEKPRVRVRPATLYIELEDVLMQWRELWNSEWFAAGQDQLVTAEWTLKDVVAHVASWTVELRTQAEILAAGADVGYRILFEETGGPRSWSAEKVEILRPQPLDLLTKEIEKETVRFQDLLFAVEVPILLAERPIGIASAAAPGEPWIRSIAGLVGMRSFHDRHHMDRIRDWKFSKLAGDF
jgi:hypothetical protein